MSRPAFLCSTAKFLLAAAVLVLSFLAGARTGVSFAPSDGRIVEWMPLAPLPPVAGAGIAWAALLVWSRRAVARGQPPTWAVLLGLLPAFGAWWFARFDPFDGWDLGDPVVALDGASYRQASGFWTAAIVRIESCDWQRTTMKVVAEAPTDSPRRYAILVNPRDRVVSGLSVTPEGLLAVGNGARCYVAYDVIKRTAIVRERLGALSPFAALTAEDVGDDEDLRGLIAAVARARNEGDGVEPVTPGDDVIARATDSPNPWVREAASRIAAAGGAGLYPRASKPR